MKMSSALGDGSNDGQVEGPLEKKHSYPLRPTVHSTVQRWRTGRGTLGKALLTY